jgi:hypothetical protein
MNKIMKYRLQIVLPSESLVKWFQDYISNRKQIVFINNSGARIGLLKAGFPQGSVLDPLLFLIYINDISDHLSSLVRLFANDTSLSSFTFSDIHQ